MEGSVAQFGIKPHVRGQEKTRGARLVPPHDLRHSHRYIWISLSALAWALLSAGNGRQVARQQVKASLALASSRNLQILAALSLARAGDAVRAQSTTEELSRSV